MIILAMLLFGGLVTAALYWSYYLPTQTERNTALGIHLAEEGLENREVRKSIRCVRAMSRALFVGMGAVTVLAAVTALFLQRAGILLELLGLMVLVQVFLYGFQRQGRKIIWLKYKHGWLDDTTKHMCRIKDYMEAYHKKPVKDLAFVPVFLLPFLAFFYPGAGEYLQGNLWHGLLFLTPFVILLALLGVYYTGRVDRNLVFLFACLEELAFLAFQWKLLVGKAEFLPALGSYLLYLALAAALLLPFIRGLLADRELRRLDFAEQIPSEGDELQLYGHRRNRAALLGIHVLWYLGACICVWRLNS